MHESQSTIAHQRGAPLIAAQSVIALYRSIDRWAVRRLLTPVHFRASRWLGAQALLNPTYRLCYGGHRQSVPTYLLREPYSFMTLTKLTKKAPLVKSGTSKELGCSSTFEKHYYVLNWEVY